MIFMLRIVFFHILWVLILFLYSRDVCADIQMTHTAIFLSQFIHKKNFPIN